MTAAVLAESKDTLTWFLGNTFALAAWWVISGVTSGVFLALVGGAIGLSLTGSVDVQKKVERWVGILGGAAVGVVGGLTVGRIDSFGGVIGLVYLWGFVGMIIAVFSSEVRSRLRRYEAEELDLSPARDTSIPGATRLEEMAEVFSRTGSPMRGIEGVIGGGMIGACFGTLCGFGLPVASADSQAESRLTHTVLASAATWAVLAGLGGGIGGSRLGLRRGMVALLFGLVVGSSFGGLAALAGRLFFGDILSGALNGAMGGAFFGGIAVNEFVHKRFF